ncbi:acyl-CoA dehydrogenase family protein [Streptomyces sp. M19]
MRELLRRSKVPEVYERALFTADGGPKKPDPRAFHLIGEGDFTRRVMVGDSVELDIAPAAALGWDTVRVDPEAPAVEGLFALLEGEGEARRDRCSAQRNTRCVASPALSKVVPPPAGHGRPPCGRSAARSVRPGPPVMTTPFPYRNGGPGRTRTSGRRGMATAAKNGAGQPGTVTRPTGSCSTRAGARCGRPPAREGATGAERIRDLAAGGYAALPIPEEFGGAGASLVEVASAQRALGMVDPSAAVALNMHAFTVGLMADYWQRHRDTSWMLLEGIAGSGALVASAFAEPGGSPTS